MFIRINKVIILLHSERPKLYTILAFLGAIGLINGFEDYLKQ